MQDLENLYDVNLYKSWREFANRCAIKIIPVVLELIPCRSVVDVGCGDGTWLKVFKEHGVADILGIDGDHIEEGTLVIPKENFKPFDLTKPIEFNKKFDLVVSLEVAEHLPPEFSEIFVNTLASLGQVIMFSAAIPYQGGVNHLNEQQPDFWAALFRKKGFVPIDYIRKKLWRDTTLAWYGQNIILFADSTSLTMNPRLRKEFDKFKDHDNYSLSIVHPTTYLEIVDKLRRVKKLLGTVDPEKMSLKKILKLMPTLMNNTIKRHLKSFKQNQ